MTKKKASARNFPKYYGGVSDFVVFLQAELTVGREMATAKPFITPTVFFMRLSL